MIKLTQEEKEDLADFASSELHPLLEKYLKTLYQEQVERFITIAAADKDRLSIEKAKLEGMKVLLEKYNQLKKKVKEK